MNHGGPGGMGGKDMTRYDQQAREGGRGGWLIPKCMGRKEGMA